MFSLWAAFVKSRNKKRLRNLEHETRDPEHLVKHAMKRNQGLDRFHSESQIIGASANNSETSIFQKMAKAIKNKFNPRGKTCASEGASLNYARTDLKKRYHAIY